jgi:hypothetical protein
VTIPTTDAADPSPAPDAPDTPVAEGAPVRPRANGLLAVTPVIATIGVAVALVGLLLVLRPVSTPTQDCGTALAFLLEGRVNEFVSETDPPEGVTKAEAKANNAEPCRVRVADRTEPAAVLFGAGMVAALGATFTEIVVRLQGWLRRRKAQRAPR